MINDNQPPSDAQTANLDPRRKRILFRCWHRGMKEMDLLLGGYVQTHVAIMADEELDELEELLQLNDQDLFSWFIGSKPVPEDRNTELFRRILAFHNK
ncbi:MULTISPECIES: succinate dehydrogenase assembly factor 2 [Pseudovibrio]|uniref:FAD assembly factor SdhE n=1 Tax=Stappiaceae TaxID=2821832 RepID=UPI002366B267|nr:MULTISPECIES: succinate dehydrogenase assembly factor 2 [Pseudovibrio]MDD7908700.1 succinate dehydrogenase assembly factor 2 [Pseudovibrio exalbescens]MDX5592773.1 succinate dehydrogenase assembly factor 2 [Pseudovibrio sp. SPO723]